MECPDILVGGRGAGIEAAIAKDQYGADGTDERRRRLNRTLLVEQPVVDHLDRQCVEERHDHGDDNAGGGRRREKTHVLSSHERSDSRSHACLPTATRGARDRTRGISGRLSPGTRRWSDA